MKKVREKGGGVTFNLFLIILVYKETTIHYHACM